nr:hypothetical protein A6C57_00845 [Fibrella sp. ES10-3-2-2]
MEPNLPALGPVAPKFQLRCYELTLGVKVAENSQLIFYKKALVSSIHSDLQKLTSQSRNTLYILIKQ